MLNKMGKILGLIFVFVFSTAKVYAFDTGADFLKFGIGARPCGMGEAFVAMHSDVTATYWNPAGLAKIKRGEYGAMHSEAVMDASVEFLGMAYPFLNRGVFGIGGIFFIPKPLPITDADGNNIGEMKWLDWSTTLSYGQQIIRRLSVGIGIKIIQKRESSPIFGKIVGTAYAADFGLIYELPYLDGLNFGFSLLNAGGKIQMEGEVKRDNLPRTIKTGLAYKLKIKETDSLIVASDLNKIFNDKARLNFGAEYRAKEVVFLRVGYYQKGGNLKGVTYGIGIKIKNLQIDWANVPSSEMIGYTRDNKISIIFHF